MLGDLEWSYSRNMRHWLTQGKMSRDKVLEVLLLSEVQLMSHLQFLSLKSNRNGT